MERDGGNILGREAATLIVARALRGFADGMVSVVLPVYLALLGFNAFEIGLIATSTLAGSSLLTYAVGHAMRGFAGRSLLMAGAFLMAISGLSFIAVDGFWPLMIVAFAGTLSPLAGDASIFLPVEQTILAHNTAMRDRTAVFARYSFFGGVLAALGALAAALPDVLVHHTGWTPATALSVPFVLYALIGLAMMAIYASLPAISAHAPLASQRPLTTSRKVVLTLTGLFCVDAFAGGLVVQSLLALWLFQRFGLDLATAATIFFLMGNVTALSMLLAPKLVRHLGLVRVMAFTGGAANLILLVLPFVPNLVAAVTLLLIRACVTQLDVPTRSALIVSVVTPEERAAAAALTSIPRSLAAAAGPMITGALLSSSAFGWPLLAAASLKLLYNLLLFVKFRHVGK